MASEEHSRNSGGTRRRKPLRMPKGFDEISTQEMENTQWGGGLGRGMGMLGGGLLGAAASATPVTAPFAPWLIGGGVMAGGEIGAALGGAQGMEAEARYAADMAAQQNMVAQQQWEYMMARHEDEYNDAQRNWTLNQISQYHTPDPSRYNLPWGPMGRG
jgi:hypothetical protein